MRELKFRIWDGESFLFFDLLNHKGSYLDFDSLNESTVIEQSTGFKDKNGVEIYFGDLMRVNRTLMDGQYPSEGIYLVSRSVLGGMELAFHKLTDDHGDKNQTPVDGMLCEKYGTLDYRFGGGKVALIAPDKYHENSMRRERWKASDETTDIYVVGNRHENPELMEPAH